MRVFTTAMHPFLTALMRGAILFIIAIGVPSAIAAPSADPSGGALPVTSALPNLAKTLVFGGWMSYCNRYERMEHAVVLSAGKTQVNVLTCDIANGGSKIPLGVDTTLTLTLDGKAVATAAVKVADVAVTFNVDITGIAEGWYRASVTGLDGSWSVLDYGVYVLKGAVAQPGAWMPVTTASHELIFEGGGRYQQTWVPTKFAPVTVAYPAREFPDLATVPMRKDVVITSLAVPRPGDPYRPALTKDGVWTTANSENYFYSDFEQPTPRLPMLDGPRGRGSIIAPTHLEVGSAAPGGALRGNVYFIESWRIGKVTPDGTVVTLAGYRHKDMASYWADPTSAELVGDWSSIPPERRGFAQPWGMAWDPRTLVINEQAAPIPSENNEKPHVLGPALYISDTYRNRVVKLEYSATAHGVPPKVTEFVTGLNQPWDVIAVGTQLYVSDRMNNAIKVFDMNTAALVKSIPVVQPEGMALLDGWLYYASVKSKSIRKINLATGEDVLIADPTVAGSGMGYFINGNSRFMKIAVSDGSFGPRGMIAYTTWSNSNFGYPNLIDGATGKSIDWISVKPGDQVKGTNPLGLGSYASAVGIGHGRMLFGTAEEGLHVVSKALETDPVIDSVLYKAGQDQWQARGYGLTHGPGGYGYYGLPLPWGVTPEIDYFLRANLHGASLPGGGTNPNIGHVDFIAGLRQCHGRPDERRAIHHGHQYRHRSRNQHVVSGRAGEVHPGRHVQQRHARQGCELHDHVHLLADVGHDGHCDLHDLRRRRHRQHFAVGQGHRDRVGQPVRIAPAGGVRQRDRRPNEQRDHGDRPEHGRRRGVERHVRQQQCRSVPLERQQLRRDARRGRIVLVRRRVRTERGGGRQRHRHDNVRGRRCTDRFVQRRRCDRQLAAWKRRALDRQRALTA